MSRKRYSIADETLTQPLCRAAPGSGSFEQRIKILAPRDVAKDPFVLFILGNESALADRTLLLSYRGYGERDDMVVVAAEHRGYGRSIPRGDQSLPGYVRIEEALADYHAVREAYRGRFPGPWIPAGYSYGGGLSIAYASAYPEDCAAVISSSGVVDWDPTIPCYDLAARENLGEELYERLCAHVDRLSPALPFDPNWLGRELLYAFVTALTQKGPMNRGLLPLVRSLAKLPTGAFLASLRALDGFAGGQARAYVASNRKTALTEAEAASGAYSWRVWRYQQAVETGTFWAPAAERSVYRRGVEDWRAECRLLFGFDPPVFSGARWRVREMVAGLRAPLVFVRGGRDPWRRLGLEPDYPLANGRILSYEEGFHCPDRDGAPGLEVIRTALELAGRGRRS